MSNVYTSGSAHPLLLSYLKKSGCRHCIVADSPNLPPGIASHPDLFMCKLGCGPDAPVFFGDPDLPRYPYPYDVLYNAACTGAYFIHRLNATDRRLLKTAENMGMVPIDVKQGYTKCNIVVLDETSLITSDQGIYRNLSAYRGLNCLLIEAGHVVLPGFETGFIGGASGRIGDAVVFHGALPRHPDFVRMKRFIESRGLTPVWFDEFPLTDIGSIIENSNHEVAP